MPWSFLYRVQLVMYRVDRNDYLSNSAYTLECNCKPNRENLIMYSRTPWKVLPCTAKQEDNFWLKYFLKLSLTAACLFGNFLGGFMNWKTKKQKQIGYLLRVYKVPCDSQYQLITHKNKTRLAEVLSNLTLFPYPRTLCKV